MENNERFVFKYSSHIWAQFSSAEHRLIGQTFNALARATVSFTGQLTHQVTVHLWSLPDSMQVSSQLIAKQPLPTSDQLINNQV